MHFSGEEQTDDVTEVILCFVSNITSLFSEITLKLEGDKASATEVYKHMLTLKTKLEQRMKDKFFGFLTSQKLDVFDDLDSKLQLEQEFMDFYQRAVGYLEKSFDFTDDSPLRILSPLALDNNTFPNIDQMIKICNLFHVKACDSLYEELCDMRSAYEANLAPQLCGNVYDKWQTILSNAEYPNIQRVVSYAL